jgi:acyl-CoA dehydrogenase
MLLLARTTPYDELADKTRGLSVFLVDLRAAGKTIEVQKLEMMVNHETNSLFIRDLEIPASDLIGEEGKGFRYILDGMNAERILVAAQAIGRARWFTDRASRYASQRVVFGRPIGANQGVQLPIARAHVSTEAADLMRYRAASLFDASERCGAEANMAKYLASEAAWEAANACMDAHGGYAFAVDYDIERMFREARLSKTAPVNNNLALAFIAEHILGMPKSY